MIRSKKKMNLIFKIWHLMKPFRVDFYRAFFITAAFEVIRMGGPFLFGKILDLLVESKGLITLQTALFVIGGLAGFRVFALIVDYLTDLVIASLLFRTEHHVSTLAFNKLLELSLDYHEKENTGNKINIVNRGVDKLINLLGNFAFTFQPIVLQLLVTVILLFITSWPIGVIFSLSLIPFFLITFKTYQTTTKIRSKRHDYYEISSGEIGDTISNITVVKAFAQEKREQRSFQSIWSVIKNMSFKEFYNRLTENPALLGRGLKAKDYTLLRKFGYRISLGFQWTHVNL